MNVTQERRHSNGLCVDCGQKLGRGKWCCDACMDKNNAEKKETRELRIMLGICTVCGKNSVPKSERICPECRAKSAEYQSELCERDRENHNNRSNTAGKRMRAKRKENGLCVVCGKRGADANYVTCRYCRQIKTQRMIAYNYRTGKIKKGSGMSYGG